MLRKETVSEPTLELLKTLLQDDLFKDFFLVGGTALALQIGHRLSIDIDLFTMNSFDEENLLSSIEDKYKFQLDYQRKNTLKGEIAGVKVDFITHNYPLVNPLLNIGGVRMASLEDITAMKLNAISGSGTRIKDFIDIAYLSTKLTLSEMINAYEEKYASRNPAMVVKALDYHADIDFKEKVDMLDSNYKWKNTEIRLKQMTNHPHSLFSETPDAKPEQEIKRDENYNRGRGFSR
jgi:hypothetical protein